MSHIEGGSSEENQMNICIDIPAPSIVAKASYLGQTSAQSLTTIFTPTATGDYKIDAYACGVNSSSSVSVMVEWTDEKRSGNIQQVLGVSGASFGQGSVVVHAALNQPIQFYTNGVNGSYDLYFTVIQE